MSEAAPRPVGPAPALVQKQAAIEPDGGRFGRFIASTNAIDRYGDVVEQNWELADFWTNPVFLWGHQSSATPIGWVRSFDPHTTGERHATHARVEFLPEGTDPFVDKLAKLVSLRAIRAVSVGFVPLEVADLEDETGRWLGYRYLRNELLELSLCTVPANPQAVSLARSLDASPQFLRRVCADQFERAAPVRARMLPAPLRVAPPSPEPTGFARRTAALLDLHRRKYGVSRETIT